MYLTMYDNVSDNASDIEDATLRLLLYQVLH